MCQATTRFGKLPSTFNLIPNQFLVFNGTDKLVTQEPSLRFLFRSHCICFGNMNSTKWMIRWSIISSKVLAEYLPVLVTLCHVPAGTIMAKSSETYLLKI